MNTEQAFIYELMQNIHRYTPPSNAEGELMGNNSRFNYGPLKDKPYVFKDNPVKESPLEKGVKIGYDMNPKDMYKPNIKQGESAIDSILYSIN